MASCIKSSSVKRKFDEIVQLPLCQYGKSCYRKNPEHLRNYGHPEESSSDDKKAKINNARKFEENNHGFYFSTVKGIDDCYNSHNVALSLQGILSLDVEKFVQSVQFNYMFDIPWIYRTYPESIRKKPMLLVHGFTNNDKAGLEANAMQYDNIDLLQAKLPIPFGTHHSKMMFLQYTHGFRIVIHTANLVQQDWYQKTQGIWKSKLFTKTNDSYQAEKDQFKIDLKHYLSQYKSDKLNKWIELIDEHDMTNAGVQLVASVPGRHGGKIMKEWGHLKMRELLKKIGPKKSTLSNAWNIVGQFSSIGSLGDDANKWLVGEWLQSFSTCQDHRTRFPLKLIYPTMENVRNSLEGYSAGGSLPYSLKNAMKQRYLKEYLCQWTSDINGRSLASPHIKSYCCLSADNKHAAWYLLTSANMSKAAWGVYEKNETQLMIRSYEIGVMFLPKNSNGFFDIQDGASSSSGLESEKFRLPYDVPLKSYGSTDKPWVCDIRYTKEDSHGQLWPPT